MKNVILAAFALIALAVFGSSCTQEQVVPAEPGTGMITFMVSVNSDETNDTTMTGSGMTTYEPVANQEIIFSLNSEDLQRDPVNGYDYEVLTYRATTDVNGMVSLEVPATGKDVSVDARFPDLVVTVKRERTDRNGDPIIVMEDEIFGGGTTTVTVFEGAKVVEEYIY